MPYSTENSQGRTFDINQPTGSPTKAFIFCHGYGGNSSAVAGQLGNPDPNDLYMVFPNGTMISNDPTKRLWNGSGGVLSLIEAGFFGNIIQHLQAFGVTEIGIGGHSNGAIISAYLAAKYPQYFKAAVLVSNYLHNNIVPVQGNITIRHYHGVNDEIVVVDGSEYNAIDNLKRFIDAGHENSKSQLLNAGHSLADINEDDFVINEIRKVMGL